MYNTETVARHLKDGPARIWINLTTSVAAKAYETRYRASAAKMASDRADKEQRKAREGKPGVRPPSDGGSPAA